MYRSPLYLLSPEQRSQLKLPDLKLLRKELLLRLELAGSTTLRINGQELDRNQLIKAVEDLKANFAFHQKVFQNQPLLAFLESGKIDFFEQPESWSDLDDPDFQAWLRPLFTERYARVLYKCVSVKGFYSINRLRVLDRTNFQLPASYRDAAYQKAFSYLQEMVTEAKTKTSYSITKTKGLLAIDPKITEYANPHFLNVFQHLPAAFQAIKTRFGIYNLLLLNAAFTEDSNFEAFERGTLVCLSYAAKISGYTNNKPDLINIGNTIDHFLAQQEMEKKSEKSSIASFIGIFVTFLLIGIFVVYLHSSGNSPSTSPPEIDLEAKIAEMTAQLREQDLIDSFSIADLVGNWHTSLSPEGAPAFGHYLSFHEDKTGISTYYFSLKQNPETCELSIPFKWSAVKIKGDGGMVNKIWVQYLEERYKTSDCYWKQLSANSQAFYKMLRSKKFNPASIEGFNLSSVPGHPGEKKLKAETFGSKPDVYLKVKQK